MQDSVIQSERLDLISLTPEFLQASLAGERDRAQVIIGLNVWDEWWQETELMRIRLRELQFDPTLQPWLLRAMALRGHRLMVGHIGFHTWPGAAYLQEYAANAVEFGYTVFSPFRRQGYAYEAAQAIMNWAHQVEGVRSFVLSISPDNAPSLGLAQKFGFKQIGTYIDPDDGPEDIFERQMVATEQ